MPSSKAYDLHLRSGGTRWLSSDHGVTLTDDQIVWTAENNERKAWLRDIAEVHLQTGNVGNNTIASCRIKFRDGDTLLIASNNNSGLQDDTHDKLYAAFAVDLHARLTALKDTQIAFTSGFSRARYRFGEVVVVIAALFFLVTPTVLFFMTGSWSMMWTLFVGAGLLWPLYRVMTANAPRSYDPRAIPPKMMPAGAGW